MMNILALGLVLTSLVTAGFFTPTPDKNKEDVIVKEGHRVVVVEFEKDDGGHTKVLISPPDSENGVVSDANDKILEKSEDAKEMAKEAAYLKPRELVCDAYGKCKHKIASTLGRTKQTVEDEAKEAVAKAKETVVEKMHDAKETVVEKGEDVIDATKNASKKLEAAKEEGKKELSEIMRRARDVAVDVFDYVSSALATLTGVLHLMGFASAYGTCVWITFASSYVLAGALPRNQFAMVQSKLYPVYFKAMGYGVGLALLGHLMSRGKMGNVGVYQGFNLAAALVMVLVNLLYLEPRATKVMLERMKKEKEEGQGKEGQVTEPSGRVMDSTAEMAGRGSTGVTQEKQEHIAAVRTQIARLSETLQRLNSYSSFLNVLTLMSLTWHLVHLGQRLHTVC